MSGDRSLYCDPRSFPVTDLADHNDIRILSEDRTQCRCKGQIHLIIHLDLIDPFNICFHRIFNSHNVDRLFIKFAQRRI